MIVDVRHEKRTLLVFVGKNNGPTLLFGPLMVESGAIGSPAGSAAEVKRTKKASDRPASLVRRPKPAGSLYNPHF
jgi:hypothetical protein